MRPTVPVVARLFLSICLVTAITPAHAQAVYVNDLQLPSKIVFTPRRHLLVAENGNGVNAGRVSLVDRNNVDRRTLISGLPAGINSAEGEPAPSGPSGLAVAGHTLYVLIAEGDGVLAGPVPGSQRANPTPASPILSSLLQFTFDVPFEDVTREIALTPADHAALAEGQTITVGSSTHATVRLVADFPNYRSVPRPDFPENVQHSDPYGVAVRGDFAYVADAGQNSIRRVNLATGAITTLAEFPSLPSETGVPLPPVDAVPDSIRFDGDRLLVTLLSGFPFRQGASKVVAVDPASGAISTVIDGLTTAIDVVPVAGGAAAQYVVAEFSSDLLTGAPGRIILVSPGAEDVVLAANVVSPSSLALDARTGEVFATQIFTGNVIRIDAAASLPAPQPSSIIPVVGSGPGAFGSQFETSLQLTNPYSYAISGVLRLHGVGSAASLAYVIDPNETKSYASLMSEAGMSGMATVDIESGVGPAPVAVTRIYETSRGSAATGGIVEQLSPDDALHAGERAVLITASDALTSRTSVGVRTLGAGAVIRYSLFRRNGNAIDSTERAYGANELVQHTIRDLFGPVARSSDSIVVEVKAGSAIVYVSTVNNETQDTSWMRAKPLAE